MGKAGLWLRADDGDFEVVERVEEALLLAHLAQLQSRHYYLQFLGGLFLRRSLVVGRIVGLALLQQWLPA